MAPSGYEPRRTRKKKDAREPRRKPEPKCSRSEETPLFVRMGKVYKLLVNEATRRKREEPLLLELAEEARRAEGGRKRSRAATQVLDLGCGTGFHARILGRAGYPVLGVDYSAPVLEEARGFRNPRNVVFQEGNLLEPIQTPEPASLTLLLGNTLSVFEKRSDLEKALRRAAQATRPNGLALVQILNYARLKRLGTVVTTRHGKIHGQETILTKLLQTVDDGRILIQLTASERRANGEWESFCKASTLQPLTPAALTAAARAAGLRLEAAWGSYAREPFDRKTSGDWIALFRK